MNPVWPDGQLETLSTAEVMRLLRVSRTQLYNLQATGKLRVRSFNKGEGAARYYVKADIVAYVAKRIEALSQEMWRLYAKIVDTKQFTKLAQEAMSDYLKAGGDVDNFNVDEFLKVSPSPIKLPPTVLNTLKA